LAPNVDVGCSVEYPADQRRQELQVLLVHQQID
jgi:hypothetical protein